MISPSHRNSVSNSFLDRRVTCAGLRFAHLSSSRRTDEAPTSNTIVPPIDIRQPVVTAYCLVLTSPASALLATARFSVQPRLSNAALAPLFPAFIRKEPLRLRESYGTASELTSRYRNHGQTVFGVSYVFGRRVAVGKLGSSWFTKGHRYPVGMLWAMQSAGINKYYFLFVPVNPVRSRATLYVERLFRFCRRDVLNRVRLLIALVQWLFYLINGSPKFIFFLLSFVADRN